MYSTSESYSKIYAKDFTVCCIHQEILEMPITDADQVRGNRESCHALDELILYRDECCR